MRKLNFAVAVFCAAVFAPFALSAQQSATAPVTVHVTDQTGATIPHAQIRLVPAPEPAPARLETDDHGELPVNLKAGGYALFVSAQGFRNWAERIYISIPASRANASQIVPVVLQIGDVSSPSPIYPRDSLVITTGADHAAVVFSPADFRTLPHITITAHNGHNNAAETYSGVPLATLLARVNAPLDKELRGEAMTSYVIAAGSDGYSVVLSLAEVDPSFHEGQVLVADTRDGKPLGNYGPFQLIVSDDKRPARWVHNLNSVTVQHAR
jgi:hypothetical protein